MTEVIAILIAVVAGRLAVIGSNKYTAGDKPAAAIYGLLSLGIFWGAVLALKYDVLGKLLGAQSG